MQTIVEHWAEGLGQGTEPSRQMYSSFLDRMRALYQPNRIQGPLILLSSYEPCADNPS
jgi:hypothetical protein